MRRNVLIILGVAVLAWAALAIVLGSPSLRLGSGAGTTVPQSPNCLPATLAHTSSLPGTGVDVSPAPGTDTANPAAQISFLGVPAAQIREVSVVGADSGRHPGALHAYSQGDGGSFEPDTPFEEGERVSVSATVGARRVAFSFRVDTPYPTAGVPSFANAQAPAPDYQSFYTMPGAEPPALTVIVPDGDPAAGDILTTNGPGPGQYGPLIYTPAGRLVWFDRLPAGETAENLSQQTYEGARDLTWWRGRVLSLGFGQGEDIIMNARYQTVGRVAGGNGLKADLHDFQIVPGNIAYITAYNPIRCDLSSVKGSKGGAIVDTAIQMIDMRTGLVRWEWHSLDHVGAAESEVEAPTDTTPWDYFHLNSIDPRARTGTSSSRRAAPGRAISCRAAAGGPVASGRDEELIQDGPRHTDTAWQHDGRVLPDGDVTFFDDGSNPPIHQPVACRADQADLKYPPGASSRRLHAREPTAAGREPGKRADARGREHGRGLRRRARHQRVQRCGRAHLRRPSALRHVFYRAFRFRGTACRRRRRRSLASLNNTGEETIVHVSWNGATKWRRGAYSRAGIPARSRRGPRCQPRASRARSPCPSSTPRGGAGARPGRARPRRLADRTRISYAASLAQVSAARPAVGGAAPWHRPIRARPASTQASSCASAPSSRRGRAGT